jgi:uncharacterized protein YlaI
MPRMVSKKFNLKPVDPKDSCSVCQRLDIIKRTDFQVLMSRNSNIVFFFPFL